MLKQLDSLISEATKTTWIMRAFGLVNIPLLFATSPKVLSIDDEHCKIFMPFRKVIKNHLGSVYFGALSIGADACIGMLATHKIFKKDKKIQLIFKSFHAEFLKRAEGPVTFICTEGKQIDQMIEEVIESGERVSHPIHAEALVNDEVVAEFVLVLSLKRKS